MDVSIYAVDNMSQMVGSALLPDGAITITRLDHQCVRGRVTPVAIFDSISEEDGKGVRTLVSPKHYATLRDMLEEHRQLKVTKNMYAANSERAFIQNNLWYGAVRSALLKHLTDYGSVYFVVFINKF